MDNTKLLNKAYSDALSYVDVVAADAEKLKEEYEQKDSANGGSGGSLFWPIFWIIICVAIMAVVATGALGSLNSSEGYSSGDGTISVLRYYIATFETDVEDILEEVMGSEAYYSNNTNFSIIKFVRILLCWILAVLILRNVKRIVSVFHIKKRNATIARYEQLAEDIRNETAGADAFRTKLSEALKSGEAIKLRSGNSWEMIIENYRSRIDSGRENGLASLIFSLLGGVGAVLLFAVLFAPFVSNALAGSFNYINSFIISMSYLVLMRIVYKAELAISNRVSKNMLRWSGIIFFLAFQIYILLTTFKKGIFTPLRMFNEYIEGISNTVVSKILLVLADVIINEGVIFFFITTFLGYMYLKRMDPAEEKRIFSEVNVIPYDNGTTRTEIVREPSGAIAWGFIAAIVAPLAMAVGAYGDIEGIQFPYIVVGGIWYWIWTSLSEARLENRLKWHRLAVYTAYIVMTLALCLPILDSSNPLVPPVIIVGLILQPLLAALVIFIVLGCCSGSF